MVSFSGIPWAVLQSQEVLIIEVQETVIIRQDSVRFDAHIPFTNPRTNKPDTHPGLIFHVFEKNGRKTSIFWRLINSRTIELLRPMVDSQTIFDRALKLYRPCKGEKCDYEVTLAPANYVFRQEDLLPGPFRV